MVVPGIARTGVARGLSTPVAFMSEPELPFFPVCTPKMPRSCAFQGKNNNTCGGCRVNRKIDLLGSSLLLAAADRCRLGHALSEPKRRVANIKASL